MISIGYERISPPPSYAPGKDCAVLSAYDWDSQSNDVKNFKNKIKIDLRLAQLGRCCYCRRQLPDPIATHLEHIVEKSVYPEFTFEVKNIGLSCALCNSRKNSHFMSVSGLLSRFVRIKTGVKTKLQRCPFLAETISSPPVLPHSSAGYRWVHPHFDNYSEHISIRRGWFFLSTSRKGLRMVRGLKLNSIALLERRALEERLASRQGPLALLIGALYELSNEQAKDVCGAVIKELQRRKKQK